MPDDGQVVVERIGYQVLTFDILLLMFEVFEVLCCHQGT